MKKLDKSKITEGKTPLQIADMAKEIGCIWSEIGFLNPAIDYFEKALKIYNSAYPLGHDSTSFVLNQLGIIAWKKDLLDDAYSWFEKSLGMDAILNNGDENTRNIARGYTNLAIIKKRKDEFIVSLKLFNSAKDILINLNEISDLAFVLFNLADLQKEMGDIIDASSTAALSLKYSRKVNKNDPLKIALSINMVGLCKYELKQYKKAIELHLEALDIYEKHCSENNYRIANTCFYLTGCYSEIKNIASIDLYGNRAIKIYEILKSSKHDFGASVEFNITKIKNIREKNNDSI